MSKSTIILIAVIAVVGMFGMTLMSSYNGLVAAQEQVNGKVEPDRYDAATAGRLDSESGQYGQRVRCARKSVIDSVTNARAKLAGAQEPAARGEANNELSGALSRLLVVVENYPQLKSDKTFAGLMLELAGTENRISVARRDYNDAVQSFNTRIKTFPTSIIAGMFGFSSKEYFRAEEGAKQVPAVKF